MRDGRADRTQFRGDHRPIGEGGAVGFPLPDGPFIGNGATRGDLAETPVGYDNGRPEGATIIKCSEFAQTRIARAI